MDSAPFDYVAEANVTASNQFHGAEIANQKAAVILINAIRALEQLDVLKKAFFYGRNLESFNTEAGHGQVMQSAAHWPEMICQDDVAKGEALLHSAIGIATESGELLEAILNAITGDKLDQVNFSEEIGDAQWYAAIGIKALGTSFDQVHRTNIAKLRARFPNAFNEHDANNRDLFAERKILENR